MDADLDKNVLTITPYSVGKTTVIVSINDQQICKLTINTILVQMSTNSALLAIKETKQLSVKGASAVAIKWSSTNPKVVTVSSKALALMLLFSVIHSDRDWTDPGCAFMDFRSCKYLQRLGPGRCIP